MLRFGACYVYDNALAGCDIPRLIYEGTHIYMLAELWDGEKGSEPLLGDTVIQISELYEKYSNDPKAFEEAVYELLWPFAEPAIKRDISNWPWIPEGYNIEKIPDAQVFGCFAWEEDEAPGTAYFHIANAFMPKSPFADMKGRADELFDMTKDILNKLPEVKIIQCKSWLNSFPPFIELFPQFWVNTKQDTNIGSCCDWWGQFMKMDGRIM